MNKKNSTAIIWMSPGNSYFDKENIKRLLEFVWRRFEWFKIMIPDYPSIYTYKAKWENNPERKARLGWNAIRNRIIWILGSEQEMEKVTISWKNDINTHQMYKLSIREILKLYRKNSAFNDAIKTVTREVLQWKDFSKKISEKDLEIWIKFLICELAFLSAAKEILWSPVTYIYHRDWSIFSDFIAGKFDGKTRDIDFDIL